MDAKRFLANFGHIANAPGGVRRLREMVLQLAISGQLCERNEGEGTGKEAIQEAHRLKAEYESGYSLRQSRPLRSVATNEIPFALPNHWVWERLGNIASYIQRGKGPKYNNLSDSLVVSQKCVQWRGLDLSSTRGIDKSALKSYGKERFLRLNDLLWNSTGTGTAGRVCIYDRDESTIAVADSHVTVIRLSNFESRYLWCVLAAPSVQARIDPRHEQALVTGTTNQVELATSSVKNLVIRAICVVALRRAEMAVNNPDSPSPTMPRGASYAIFGPALPYLVLPGRLWTDSPLGPLFSPSVLWLFPASGRPRPRRFN